MTSISGVGSTSTAWPEASSSRSERKDRLFAKVDTDGNGSIDKSELQGMLDKIATKTGGTAQSADDLFAKIDTDGDGSISKDELGAAAKTLFSKPSSTVDFAHRAGGPPHGPPPAERSGSAAPTSTSTSSTSSSSTTSTDPLDTNGDGVVSASERVAGDLKQLFEDLKSALHQYQQTADSTSAQVARSTQSIAA